MSQPVLCGVCCRQPARRPSSPEPRCVACEAAHRFWQDHPGAQLDRAFEHAEEALLEAVVRLRRLKDARSGFASLTRFVPPPKSRHPETTQST